MKKQLILGWTLVPVLLLASGAVFAKKPTAISDCDTYITKPGKYWLVNDLACEPGVRPIKILSSDVSLDLRGHSVSCAAGDRSGVVVGDDAEPEVFSDVRISNGSINGCAVGVLLWFTDGARVTEVSFSGSTESGVTLVEAQNSVIMKNNFEGDFWAINSYEGTGNRLTHNTIRYSIIGIDLYGETDSRINCNAIDRASSRSVLARLDLIQVLATWFEATWSPAATSAWPRSATVRWPAASRLHSRSIT